MRLKAQVHKKKKKKERKKKREQIMQNAKKNKSGRK